MTLQRVLLNQPEMVRESINMVLANQVLLNLMDNAVKFTDHGKIGVESRKNKGSRF